uniref:Uncharacterized protein n=1 Tax=Rhizophora mucronata TaxID=61149 RepID=A0A2P2IXP9_RHIMU
MGILMCFACEARRRNVYRIFQLLRTTIMAWLLHQSAVCNYRLCACKWICLLGIPLTAKFVIEFIS